MASIILVFADAAWYIAFCTARGANFPDSHGPDRSGPMSVSGGSPRHLPRRWSVDPRARAARTKQLGEDAMRSSTMTLGAGLLALALASGCNDDGEPSTGGSE